MAEFTLDLLVAALQEHAGVVEDVDMAGDILDASLEELGYDSLGLLNTVRKLERQLDIRLPDDIVGDAVTPRDLLREINAGIEHGVAAPTGA